MSKFLLATAALVLAGSSAFASGRIYPTPNACSRAGDQTSRPVLKVIRGQNVLVGYECIQDNRGNGN